MARGDAVVIGDNNDGDVVWLIRILFELALEKGGLKILGLMPFLTK